MPWSAPDSYEHSRAGLAWHKFHETDLHDTCMCGENRATLTSAHSALVAEL